MKTRFLLCFLLFLNFVSYTQPSRHVVLISIDGLHPDMCLDPSWPAPNLRKLLNEGTYAHHLKSVFPAYTYPSHAAMITGALPARSGIYFNQSRGNSSEWNWETSRVKVPTLWQVLEKAGRPTASVMWPGSVGSPASYNVPEIWAKGQIDDRISESRKYAKAAGLVEEIERNATGRLDSTNMNGNYFSFDANSGRMAAYILRTYRPAFLSLHIALVDDEEHDFGRDGDSVRLAVAVDDRVVGDLLETINRSDLKDSTTIIIVGDHGFCNIQEVFRPNMLIRDLPARFTAAGGAAFLYPDNPVTGAAARALNEQVIKRLDSLPEEKRKQFRILDRAQLDRMGVDSVAILALAAYPGMVFSGSLGAAPATNQGPGTTIQQSPLQGMFIPIQGGHHGYDPDLPDMYTGFIAWGFGIRKGDHIEELCEVDIAPLVAALLGVRFSCPDGHLIPGILSGTSTPTISR